MISTLNPCLPSEKKMIREDPLFLDVILPMIGAEKGTEAYELVY